MTDNQVYENMSLWYGKMPIPNDFDPTPASAEMVLVLQRDTVLDGEQWWNIRNEHGHIWQVPASSLHLTEAEAKVYAHRQYVDSVRRKIVDNFKLLELLSTIRPEGA